MQEHASEIRSNRNTLQQQPCLLKIQHSFANMFGKKYNAAWIYVLLVFYQRNKEIFLIYLQNVHTEHSLTPYSFSFPVL